MGYPVAKSSLFNEVEAEERKLVYEDAQHSDQKIHVKVSLVVMQLV